MDTNKDVETEDTKEVISIDVEDEKIVTSLLTYKLTSTPPFAVIFVSALQHALLCIPGSLFISTVIADTLCIPYTHPIRAALFCSALFMSGFCTLIQVAFGLRLPILQGPSAVFLIPLMALKNHPGWECSEDQLNPNAVVKALNTSTNTSLESQEVDDAIYNKLQEVSGALMFSSLMEIIAGSMGLMGVILRFIGPITIAVTISLIGIALIPLPVEFAKASYPMGIACMVLIVIFILYCQSIKIPIPRCGKARKEKGKVSFFPVFQLIPILTGLLIMWFVSWILTLSNVFTNDKTSDEYYARTDANQDAITLSPWFIMPYPGMWGPPKMNLALALGFVFGATASMVESVGDYHAAYKACEVERPPDSAITRGILVEGLGTLVSGAVGVGHATTSLSGSIGILILSKTASRVVMYAVGFMLILLSLFAKAGAVMTGIPKTILGGIGMVTLSTLVVIGLSNLRAVDMTCTRNLIVVGFPIVCGIGVPSCIKMYPGVIDTGIEEVTQLLQIVLGTPMFIGGLLAILLDNTVAGTPESRGIVSRQGKQLTPREFSDEDTHTTYSWSWYPRVAESFPFLTYLPFMPPNPVQPANFELVDAETECVVKNGAI